ncbi:hypothetical protein ABZ128_09490 [Streptomyces sp. NPDC006326]|uniref:hypothetical protein n=1 Tax=Streptomyces sp. NPDC006326 TaxID=3156752 RepID=UPI0033A912C9
MEELEELSAALLEIQRETSRRNAARIRAWERASLTLLPLERGAAKGAASLIDPEEQ